MSWAELYGSEERQPASAGVVIGAAVAAAAAAAAAAQTAKDLKS